MEDLNTEIVASTVEDGAGKTAAPSQESKRSEADKAAFSLRKNAERVKELGLDPAEVLGVKPHIEVGTEDEDDKPVTVGMLRDLQKKDAQKTAIQMAEEITDEETRNAVKEALTDSVVPSGNPEKDFRFALGAVSAPKNKQVIEEINRYTPPKRTAAGGSMAAHIEEEFTPTEEEQWHMQSFGITKEHVLAARKASANKQ